MAINGITKIVLSLGIKFVRITHWRKHRIGSGKVGRS